MFSLLHSTMPFKMTSIYVYVLKWKRSICDHSVFTEYFVALVHRPVIIANNKKMEILAGLTVEFTAEAGW